MGGPPDYVLTPAGWYHKSCVYEIPNGSSIDIVNGTQRITHPDGSTVTLPPCSHPAFGVLSETGVSASADVVGDTGFVESVNASLYSGFSRLSAKWVVPNNLGTYPDGQPYYTFPSLYGSHYILQPVLEYGSYFNLWNTGNYWTISAWACGGKAVGYNCPHSMGVPVSPGDTILGTVIGSTCGSNHCNWVIMAQDLKSGAWAKLPLNGDVSVYSVAQGGAVEVKGLTSCSLYPLSGVAYASIGLLDIAGNVVAHPPWRDSTPSNVSPDCGWSAHAPTDNTVTLGPYMAVPDGPSTLKVPGESCTWTVHTANPNLPLTYSWTYDGVIVGTASSYSAYLTGQVGERHTLSLLLTDSAGTRTTTTWGIVFKTVAPPCHP